MIKLTTGNILESDADAIVNTVNCEGFMGKGIAYQFKLKYPENNIVYEKTCRQGNFNIGDLLIVKEQNKIIINFPTKDRWRMKSEYKYIEAGLNTLVEKLNSLEAKSIALPPLGCGNGGLDWIKVKAIILEKLLPYENDFNFILYEPSSDIKYLKNKNRIPKLNASHLLLMRLKMGLNKFNKTRLQKSAFMVNFFSGEDYFKFSAYNFGPYNHSIDILARDIKEFQDYYSLDTKSAYELAINTLMSEKTNIKIDKFTNPINSSISLLNSIKTDRQVELMTTILFILQNNKITSVKDLPNEFEKWSSDKADRFSSEEIFSEVENLLKLRLISDTLMGLKNNRK